MFCTISLPQTWPVSFVNWINLCQVCGSLFKAVVYIQSVQLNLMFFYHYSVVLWIECPEKKLHKKKSD